MRRLLRFIFVILLIVSIPVGWQLYRLTQKPLLIPDFSANGLTIEGLVIDWNGDLAFRALNYPGIQIQGLKTRLALFRLLNKHIEFLHIEHLSLDLPPQESEPDNRPPILVVKDMLQQIAMLRDYRLDELKLGEVHTTNPDVSVQDLSLSLRRGRVTVSGAVSMNNLGLEVKRLYLDALRAPDELGFELEGLNGTIDNQSISLASVGLRFQILDDSMLWLTDFSINSLKTSLDSTSYQKIEPLFDEFLVLNKLNLKNLQIKDFSWPQPALHIPAFNLSILDRKIESHFDVSFTDGISSLKGFEFFSDSDRLDLGLSLFRLYLMKKELLQIDGLKLSINLEPQETLNIPLFQIKNLKVLAESFDLLKQYTLPVPVDWKAEFQQNLNLAKLDSLLVEGFYLREFPEGNMLIKGAAIRANSTGTGLSFISSDINLLLENQPVLELKNQRASLAMDSDNTIHVREFLVDGLSISETFVKRFTTSQPQDSTESSPPKQTDSYLPGEIRASFSNIHLLDTATHIKNVDVFVDVPTLKWDVKLDVNDVDVLRLKPDLPLKKLSFSSLGGISGQGLNQISGDLKFDFILTHESVSLQGVATVIGQDLTTKIAVDPLGVLDLKLGLGFPQISVKSLRVQSLNFPDFGLSVSSILATAVVDLKEQNLKSHIYVPKTQLYRSSLQDTGIELKYSSKGISATVTQGGGLVYLDDLVKVASAQKKRQSTATTNTSTNTVYTGPDVKLLLMESSQPVRMLAEGFETKVFARGAFDVYSGASEPRVTGLIRIPDFKYSGMGIKAELKQPARMEWIGTDVTSLGQLRFVTEDLNAQLLSMWQESNRRTVYETGLIVFFDLLTEFQGGKYNLRVEGPYPRFYYKLTSINGTEEEGVLGILVQLLANKLQGGNSSGNSIVLPQELFMTHRNSMMNAGVNSLLNQNMPKALQLRADVLGEQKAMGIKTQATENISIEVIQQMGPQGNSLIQSMQWQMRQDMNVELERIEGDTEDTKLKLRRQIRF